MLRVYLETSFVSACVTTKEDEASLYQRWQSLTWWCRRRDRHDVFVSADEAKAKGLVNRVAPAEALDAELERLVASIVAKPRVAVAMGKALFYRQIEKPIAEAYGDAGSTMACNMMDESALEGVQAFIEKRPPNWGSGR